MLRITLAWRVLVAPSQALGGREDCRAEGFEKDGSDDGEQEDVREGGIRDELAHLCRTEAVGGEL